MINTPQAPDIALSPLDTERFGVQTVKAHDITVDSLPQLAAFCDDHHAQFAIVRVKSQHLDAVQQLEATGYRLMDTLVYYAFKYNKYDIPADRSAHHIRPIQPGDFTRAEAIAAASFQGYYGHYHADDRLDNAVCDAIYTDWAQRSIRGNMADTVLVAATDDNDDDIHGFATLRMNTPDEGEGVLFGVAPESQGQGIYHAMMIGGMQWCKEQGAQRMVVSTQITNIAVQKVWARLGFEFDRAYYTLHNWFDTPSGA